MNCTVNNDLKQQIAAIILAAGQSKRFGKENKLLTSLSGEPLIRRTLQSIQRFGVGHIIVVTGHDERQIRDAIATFPVTVTHNEYFSEGMGTSIATGILAVPENLQAAAICLSDMPNISSTTFDVMVQRLAEANDIEKAIVAPRLNNQLGHPVLFGSHYFSALSRLSGDKGARDLIRENQERFLVVDVDDPGIHQDFDVTADFQHKT